MRFRKRKTNLGGSLWTPSGWLRACSGWPFLEEGVPPELPGISGRAGGVLRKHLRKMEKMKWWEFTGQAGREARTMEK